MEHTRIHALEIAWGIIANAGGGDWSTQSPEWQEAAERWRDQYASRLYSEPDAWAPLNRRGEPYRDEIDAFRNLRMATPLTWRDAVVQMHLALECYEHARENERAAVDAYNEHNDGTDQRREQAITALMVADPKATPNPTDEQRATWAAALGEGRSASSRTAAEKLADVTPHMVTFLAAGRKLWIAKAEAEKEVSVARRRLNTATAVVETWQDAPELMCVAAPVFNMPADGSPEAAELFDRIVNEGRTRAQRMGVTNWTEV